MNWLDKYNKEDDEIANRQLTWIGVVCLFGAIALYIWEYWV